MKGIKWAVFFSGIAAVTAQILMIREGIALFGGYELISGILLCFWLVWAGMGSFVFSKLKSRLSNKTTYSILLIMLSIFMVFSITFIRFALEIFSLPFGEVISLDKIILISLVSLAPTCLVFGALFPAASRLIEPEKVYFYEGIGSFCGGIAVSFILIQILPTYGILLLMVCLLFTCAFIITDKRKLLIIPVVLLLIFFKINDIERFFRSAQMPGQELVGLRESKYGMIAVTRTGAQVNFYVNGVYDFSYPDLYSSEEAVHYPLLLHGKPESVLLVGGGVGSCIKQILKHHPRQLTYIELDPLLVHMGEFYTGESFDDLENVSVVFGDARFYIKRTKKKYDVVIINLPDPVNAQVNRFYTTDFFAEAKRILNKQGILSIRINAPPDIISPLFGQFLSTIAKSLNTSFEHTLVLPAAKTTFLASDYEIALANVVNILKERSAERNLALQYVNEYYFDYNLTAEKMSYLEERVEASCGVLNTDLKPVCYYFTMILWGGVLSENIRAMFIKWFNINPLFFLLLFVPALLFFRRRSIIYLSVFTIGASEISAEVILIILFQVYYGYVYSWIGAIIAFYMLGLALGTLFYMRSMFFRRSTTKILSNVEFIMAFYFVIVLAVTILKIPGTTFIISFLIFFGGFMGGLHFPLSIALLKRRHAGSVYSVDLFGSSLGALITAVVFIPILGIVFTLFLFFVFNVVVGIGLRIFSSK
jgi:spermidine synthase